MRTGLGDHRELHITYYSPWKWKATVTATGCRRHLIHLYTLTRILFEGFSRRSYVRLYHSLTPISLARRYTKQPREDLNKAPPRLPLFPQVGYGHCCNIVSNLQECETLLYKCSGRRRRMMCALSFCEKEGSERCGRARRHHRIDMKIR